MKLILLTALFIFTLPSFATDHFIVTGKIITYYGTEADAESFMWSEALDTCKKEGKHAIRFSDITYTRDNSLTTASAEFSCNKI